MLKLLPEYQKDFLEILRSSKAFDLSGNKKLKKKTRKQIEECKECFSS